MIEEIAPAKINLYLHVGALRRDRLHDLRSVFVFADGGDLITAEPARDLTLTITGPYAAPLLREPAERNLVLRAARLLQAAGGAGQGARLTLDKRLPIASGVGGGSADAAATIRALMKLWRLEMSDARLRALAFSLGADVPACLSRAPVLVSGAGERLGRAPRLPPLAVCLVNTGAAMPTGPVFRAFDEANPAPAPPRDPSFEGLTGPDSVRALLARTRNDLEPHAIVRAPSVRDAINRLSRAPGALPARMSGSGATVFALFVARSAAARAAQAMRGQGWWAMDANLYGAGAS